VGAEVASPDRCSLLRGSLDDTDDAEGGSSDAAEVTRPSRVCVVSLFCPQDILRPAYMVEHLLAVQAARERGARRAQQGPPLLVGRVDPQPYPQQPPSFTQPRPSGPKHAGVHPLLLLQLPRPALPTVLPLPRAGIRVRGYTFWTAADNWEWADGYCPKFGLVAVNRSGGANTAGGGHRS